MQISPVAARPRTIARMALRAIRSLRRNKKTEAIARFHSSRRDKSALTALSEAYAARSTSRLGAED